MPEQEKHVFLVGYMGTGKTSVSKKLSYMLKTEYVEMDSGNEKRAGMKISCIFEQFGESRFRDMESEILKDICRNEARLIVSCGGGVVLRQENVVAMKKRGVVILLTAKPETLLVRLQGNKDRPLIKDNMTKAHIEKMIEERAWAYKKAVNFTVATDNKDLKEIAEEIAVYL